MTFIPTSRNASFVICLLLLAIAISIPGAAAITLTPGSSATTTTISQGDPVYIEGIATGHPQVGLQIWFIGYNFARVSTVQVNDDNTYEYELQKADTANLAPGQYFVLIQHPMENGRFDVVYDASSGSVTNVQTGKTIYKFTGSGSLQSSDSVTALMNAIGSQNIDDTFATVTFYVSQPTVTINPIGDKQTGDTFTINGTTSLAAGDELMVEITSSSYMPTSKTQPSGFSGASGTVNVVAGSNGINIWSFDVDTSSFPPDEYLVKVSGVLQDVTTSATFNVVCSGTGDTCSVPALASAVTTTAPAIINTPATTTTIPDTTVVPSTDIPVTTQRSPVPVALCLGSIAAVLLLRRFA
jgi:trimeric autotransporter adhesin